MEEPKKRYILLVDHACVRTDLFSKINSWMSPVGLDSNSMRFKVPRGELLEVLPAHRQPSDVNRVALVNLGRRPYKHLECPMADLTLLSDEEANLLWGIPSPETRFQTFIDKNRLDFGRRLLPGSQVFVGTEVEGSKQDLPGVVRFKELKEIWGSFGTVFGVELTEGEVSWNCEEMPFSNKCNFIHRGFQIGLDALTPREDPDLKSSKRDTNGEANVTSRCMDAVVPYSSKQMSPHKRINQVLEIKQRVVTFIKDYPARGTVRYIDKEGAASGMMHTIVGLEMDEKCGSGTGEWNGQQLFVCKRDFAVFVDINGVIREEDFDGNRKETTCTGTKTPEKQGATPERIQKDGVKLSEKDQHEENLQRQFRQMEQQLREKEDQKENLQRQLRKMEQQLTKLQDQYQERGQQVSELEKTLSIAQQALREHESRQVTPEWVISRDQIQLTGKLLGRGGWGSVFEGKYCGCSVAVKQIHELILSPHNRSLFEREMDIASRCRHPCLLQFIGATNDEGSPLFVTELMESSLRALLGQRPLPTTEVSIISLDVARALNYLHQKKPSPIVHRDISSANVLLWRQGDQWRGKVSDYGTANFMQHTMTVGPGAAIYMAPEALTPNQTVKVDVYSFGVLLCEMCIRELPDPGKRDQQIAIVTNRLFRALIRRCLQSEPAVRPNMEEIIEELEKPVS